MSAVMRQPGAGSETSPFVGPTAESARLFKEGCRYIPGGTSRQFNFFRPYPIYIRSGAGCRITDVDGVERIDFLNNMTALIHGHANPVINRAIVDQVQRGTAFSEPAEQEIALARLMVERVSSVEQIRFANSGTEATMLAAKLARAFTGRSRIAKFEGFYHGYYDYVQVSASSTPANWGPAESPASVASTAGLAASVEDSVLVLPFNNRDAVERLLVQHGHSIAALIVDPLSNRAGFPLAAEGFLDFLRQITRAYGILLMYDEVICFRISYHGAQGKYGGDPDLTVFGKIIGGGLPVGAVGGRSDVMALLDPTVGAAKVLGGGTFSANPMTMAAGLAAMEQATPALYERIDVLGRRLRAGGNAVFAATGEPGQVAGDGSLFRILLTSEPVVDYRSGKRAAAPPERMAQLHLNLLNEGIVVGATGLGCLSAPMTDAEIDDFLGGLERAISRLPERGS